VTKDEREPAEALAGFAAGALDWPAVRALLLPLAASAIGRRALEDLAPRPAEEAALALQRGRELLELGASAEPPLAGVPDPVPGLREAARYGRTLSGEDLFEVARVLRLVEDVGHWLLARGALAPTCGALWNRLPDLRPLRTRLEDAVDRRGRVVDDASPRLTELRRTIAQVGEELERAMRELAGRAALRTAFAEGHGGRIHRRGGRRVFAVRRRHAGQVPGIVHDRSQSGETIFVEPREVVEQANSVATAEADAEREVNRILTELTREVLQRRESIEVAVDRLGELELALVSARYAALTGGRPARLPGEPGAQEGLVLRGWRHPLLLEQERLGRLDGVVALDLRLGADFDLLVVTGPNTGGKTLALKGAGLAALLTRMGLALPCDEGTTVPLYAGVVADIGDEQEIQQSLSTFSSHLVRVRDALERAGPETLVLLDELGGGTDPSEGAALGEAILERLLAKGAPTLASTHLGKLKEVAFRWERAENAHVEFDLETLAPRYRLVIGAPGESRALAIARRLGLADDLIARAESRVAPDSTEAEALMGEMRDVRLEAERLRGQAEERLLETERRLAGLAEEEARVDARRAHLEAEAQRGLEERLTRAREWVERGRALLPRLDAGTRAEVEPVVQGLESALADAAMTDRRQSFVRGLKKGSTVWLPRFKKRCEVTRVHRDREELSVRVGKHELTVAFDDVTFYESL
jgi:DNA mismatch repair protein MutS2